MDEPTRKPRRRIFHYGCLAGLVLLLMLVLGGLFGLYYAKKMFNDFTDTKPAALPQVQMTQAEMDLLQQRVDSFRQAARAGKTTAPLILTADEINVLIATDPDLSAFKGKLYVKLSGKQVDGQLSVPMESLGLTLFRGRYLNGTATFVVALRNGQIGVRTLSLVVKGKRVPEVYMEQIRKQNLAEGFNSQPRAVAALDRLQDIKVEEGRLIVVPKEKKSP